MPVQPSQGERSSVLNYRETMAKILSLVLGGAIGALLRYFVSGITHKYFEGVFPLGTLAVNLMGSFAIGILWGLLEIKNVSPLWRTFLFVGILGSFTTMSTFTLESFNLIRDGEIKFALANILANNVLAILLVFAGFSLTREIMSLAR